MRFVRLSGRCHNSGQDVVVQMERILERGDTSSPIGLRLKRARQRKGLSRRVVADSLNVNVSAVVAWESGKYLPRDSHRVALARLLSLEIDEIFEEEPGAKIESAISAALLRGPTLTDESLAAAVGKCSSQLNSLRIAQPLATTRHHQCEFRKLLSRRLLDHSLTLMQVEIFYTLDRLREVLFNVLHYDRRDYCIKTFVNAPTEPILPCLDAYMFDNGEAVLASYWIYDSPDERPLIKIKGEPFESFLADYWREAWRRASTLNLKGADELGLIKEIALRLGLKSEDWPRFVEEAHALEIGDGAPPLP